MPFKEEQKMYSQRARQRIKLAKWICEKYEVRFYPLRAKADLYAGYAFPWKSHIAVNVITSTFEDFISTVFHEIAHCINYRRKKYYKFHNEEIQPSSYMRRIALRAEIYTDKVAKQLAKENGFGYIPVYSPSDENRQYLAEYYGY